MQLQSPPRLTAKLLPRSTWERYEMVRLIHGGWPTRNNNKNHNHIVNSQKGGIHIVVIKTITLSLSVLVGLSAQIVLKWMRLGPTSAFLTDSVRSLKEPMKRFPGLDWIEGTLKVRWSIWAKNWRPLPVFVAFFLFPWADAILGWE